MLLSMYYFIRYAYRDRVGVTHRIRGNFGFGSEVVDVVVVVEVVVPSGVEVVEVVDVVEVVVLGASSWRTLAFRASGSTGFTASGYSGIGPIGHA